MKPFDLGWLVGIYEGEGSCGVSGTVSWASITSTDMDLLERVVEITELGRIYENGSQSAFPNAKRCFQWKVQSIREAQEFLSIVYPHLSERRREQADVVLAQRYKIGQAAETCRNGHPRVMGSFFVRRDGSKICYECRRDRKRRKEPKVTT